MSVSVKPIMQKKGLKLIYMKPNYFHKGKVSTFFLIQVIHTSIEYFQTIDMVLLHELTPYWSDILQLFSLLLKNYL